MNVHVLTAPATPCAGDGMPARSAAERRGDPVTSIVVAGDRGRARP